MMAAVQEITEITLDGIIKDVLSERAPSNKTLPGSNILDLDAPWSIKMYSMINRNRGSVPAFLGDLLDKMIVRGAGLEHSINTNRILSFVQPISPGVALILALSIGGISLGSLARRKPLFLSHLLGVGYPIYRSILAIERPRVNDDERWLTYCKFKNCYLI